MTTPHLHPASRLALGLALALGIAAAQAQTSTAPAGTTTTTTTTTSTPSAQGAASAATPARMARGDRKFVQDAAAAGMAEVMLGKLGQQRAAHADVKQYAQHMVNDHTKSNDELMALAQAKSLKLPALPTATQQRLHDRMAKLEGAEFDRMYMAQMLGDHRKAVALFQKQARSGQDTELKAFAAKTLPTLQDHLKQATALHDALKQQARR